MEYLVKNETVEESKFGICANIACAINSCAINLICSINACGVNIICPINACGTNK